MTLTLAIIGWLLAALFCAAFVFTLHVWAKSDAAGQRDWIDALAKRFPDQWQEIAADVIADVEGRGE